LVEQVEEAVAGELAVQRRGPLRGERHRGGQRVEQVQQREEAAAGEAHAEDQQQFLTEQPPPRRCTDGLGVQGGHQPIVVRA